MNARVVNDTVIGRFTNSFCIPIVPFPDGNGRSSRALLNWMLRKKGLPPIYFKLTEKESYYKALEKADGQGDYLELLRVTIRELFRTIMRKS